MNIKYFGINPFFPITSESTLFVDVVFWVIVCLLSLELIIGYLKVRNTNEFLKKYWLEILMLVLMPVFVGFKFMKITLKIVKQLKIAKTGLKLIHKMKK